MKARRAGWALLSAAALSAAAVPGRHLRYAESDNRLVYAFVFGHRDTCRVIRRAAPPPHDFEWHARRPPRAGWKGGPGETLIREFDFGSMGRPLHLVPSNDGRFLVTFANRAPGGAVPTQDRVHLLEEKDYSETLDYSKLPADRLPAWPAFERALRPSPPPVHEEPGEALSYAFFAREKRGGRLLVARQTEGEQGAIGEMVCFTVELPGPLVELPGPDVIRELLGEEEPLWRAGAAWVAAHAPSPELAGPLRGALKRTGSGPARAALARALVACGDEAAGRQALRALLKTEEDAAARAEAARALALLPPGKGDAEALAAALPAAGERTRGIFALALARIGRAGLQAVVRLSRSGRTEARAAAARALGHFAEPEAEQRLLVLALDRAHDVQTAVATALTAPPRAILPEHHAEFARALDACRATRHAYAMRRLSLLAAHARIRHEKVLEALVKAAAHEPAAIQALARLTGKPLKTPEDCRAWWGSRG